MYRGEVGHGVYLRDIAAYGIDKARPYLTALKTVSAVGATNLFRSPWWKMLFAWSVMNSKASSTN